MDERVPRQLFCNPSRGLPLYDALIYYNRNYGPLSHHFLKVVFKYQTFLNMLFFYIPHQKTVLTERLMEEIRVSEGILSQQLCQLLLDGTLIAKAYTATGQINRTLIPADWWTRVHFDALENWAEAHETRLRDVYIFPALGAGLLTVPRHQEEAETTAAHLAAAEIEALSQERSEATATAATSIVARMEAWYLQEIVAPWRPGVKAPTQAEDRKAAKAIPEFSEQPRAMIDGVRRRCAPPEWDVGRPGRKRTKQ